MEPLVKATDLAGFPGAPFSDTVAAAAGGAIRREAGWHIAPEVTETLIIETGRSSKVLLPTMQVSEITEVRDEDGTVLDEWRMTSRTGVLTRRRGVHWPEVIEVDLVHGYAVCPPELLPILAERAQRGTVGLIRQESLGSRSVSLAQAYDPSAAGILQLFALGPVAS